MDESTSTLANGYDVRDGLATIVLPAPSLSTAGKVWLRDSLVAVGADDAVRAVILTGSGKAFCVGQDLSEHAEALAADPGSAFDTLEQHYEPIITALTTMPKPVLAAVNGACVGAGLSIILACDVRLARAGATFATAFTAIGLSFDSGLSASLARALGSARASELITLSEPFSAEQAAHWGLIGRVVDADVWDATVTGLGARLAGGPTQAYAAAKRALAGAWTAPLDQVLAHERDDQRRLGLTQDHLNAVEAFLNKQRPTFTGLA